MATNPMQRKARNSFLLGMLITLIITGLIIALLAMQLMNMKKQLETKEDNIVNAYALTEDVKSGQIITGDMLEKIEVNSTVVPSNATSDLTQIDNYFLEDKQGNEVTTSYDNSGNATLYISINDVRYQIKQDDNGNYYIENNNGQMEYIELSVVPYVAKVDMKKNTLITKELLSKADNVVKNDMRKQEYNVVVLPLDLDTGDYIDIRLMLPNGQDFIVVSKKEVEVPYVGDVPSADTIWVNLSEDEILHMSSAIVDASKILGAKLYATKYTEPGMQEAAIPTYIVSAENSQLLQRDPNIVESAMEEIIARYNQVDSTNIRNNNINTEIQKQGDQADSNLQTEIEDSVTRSQEARQDYLDSLSSTTTTTTTGTTSTTTTTTE